MDIAAVKFLCTGFCVNMFSVLWCIQRSGIAMSNNCFCFWGTAKLFSRKTTIFHSHQQCVRVTSPHPCRLWLLSSFSFLVIAIPLSVKWHFIVILTCISLVINDVEPFFIVLIGHLYIFFQEMSIQILSAVWNNFFSFCCWVVVVLYIVWILDPYQINDLQIFSPTLWVVFSFSLIGGFETKNFKLFEAIV